MNSNNADRLAKIETSKLIIGKYQPRKTFCKDGLNDLANSITENGVISPLTVRKTDNDNYEVIAGERRWRATVIAGLKEIPCIIQELTNKDAALISLIENIQREDLQPLEEAEHIQNTINMFGASKAEVGRTLGKSRSWVSNLLRLTDIANSVKEMLRNKEIEATHARALLTLDNHKQYLVAKEIVEKKLTVRETETLVKNISQGLSYRRKNNKDIDLISLERNLSEKLNAPVKFNLKKDGSGNVEIRYYSHEELESITGRLTEP